MFIERVTTFFKVGNCLVAGLVSWFYTEEFFTKLQKFFFKGWTTNCSPDISGSLSLTRGYDLQGPVCVITDTWPPEINGVALQMELLVTLLLEAGEQVVLLRPDLKDSRRRGRYRDRLERQRNGSWLTEVLFPRVANALNPDTSICFPNRVQVRRILELHKPRVIYLATVFALSRCSQILAIELGIPTILRLGTDWDKVTPYYVPLPQCLINVIHNRIGWSTREQATFMHLLNKDFAEVLDSRNIKYYIQPNSVDTELFHPKHRSEKLRRFWGADEDTLVCCYIGRISHEKNVELAFQAFDAILRRRCTSIFVVVGDGVMFNWMKATYGDREEIKFTGKLTGKILRQHYASADLYIFPSKFETFGNTIFESMASGTPVVGFSYAALKEFITDEISGVLADCDLGKVLERTANNNTEESRAFIEAALKASNAPLKEMGLRARELVVNRCSPERFIKEFLLNIDRVISQ